MGVYLYTFRKKSRKVLMEGKRVDVYAYDYALKCFWDGRDKVVSANANERFAAVQPEYVVVGGFEDRYSVYKNVTCGHWYDTEYFPGERVGVLHKVGQRWECILDKKV